MDLIQVEDLQLIYKGWKTFKVLLGRTWQYEIYTFDVKSNQTIDRIFKTDNDEEAAKEFSKYSIQQNSTNGFPYNVNKNIYTLFKGPYKYTCTTLGNIDEYTRIHKSTIDNYFNDCLIKDREELLNNHLRLFKTLLKEHTDQFKEAIKRYHELGINTDLFMAEVAKHYADNFKHVLSLFKDKPLMNKLKSLFTYKP